MLVQVPRAGYLVALVCQDCREPMRCGFCGGPTRAQAGESAEVATVRSELRVVRPAADRLGMPDLRLSPGPGADRRRRADGGGAGQGVSANTGPDSRSAASGWPQ